LVVRGQEGGGAVGGIASQIWPKWLSNAGRPPNVTSL